jgi:hypothetical protein
MMLEVCYSGGYLEKESGENIARSEKPRGETKKQYVWGKVELEEDGERLGSKLFYKGCKKQIP